MVKITLKVHRPFRLRGLSEKYANELVQSVAYDGVNTMEEVTPKKTNKGSQSYYLDDRTNTSIKIKNSTFYLPYVNDGTGIYIGHDRIRPKKAKYLHFFAYGREWFLKSVRGQKPQNFVQKGVKIMAMNVGKKADKAAKKVFR